jgi:hypothetical protein
MKISDEIALAFSKLSKYAVDKEYEIGAGDNLWDVAQKFDGVSVEDIKKANPGIDPKTLQLGQIIIIPEGSVKPKEIESEKPDDLQAITTQPGAIQTLHQLERAIQDAAQAEGIPSEILRGVVAAESSGNPQAAANSKNPQGGALGLTQLSPYARSVMGVSDPYDIKQNLAGGARWLKTSYNEAKRLRGIEGATSTDLWSYALMIYHAGQPAVQKWVSAGKPSNGHGQVGLKTIQYPRTVFSRRSDPGAFSLHWKSE